MPACLVTKIQGMQSDPKQQAPESVTAYNYKGQQVYYIRMTCCDKFNEVYDGNCNYLGAPDGGVSGKGDGKLPEFFANTTDKKNVWQGMK